MVKTICLVLIAAGAALIAIGIYIFVSKGLIHVYKDLKTTKKIQTDVSVENVATSLYYNEILKKQKKEARKETEEISFQRAVKRKAKDNSSVLYEKQREPQKTKTDTLSDLVFAASEKRPAVLQGKASKTSIKSSTGTDMLNHEEIKQVQRTADGTDILEDSNGSMRQSPMKNDGNTDILDTDILSSEEERKN